MQHTFFCTFLCRCFARLRRETSRTFLVTSFMEEMSYVFSFTFSALPLNFHLALVAASISRFVTAATKFFCCSSNKKMSLLFVSLALDLCRPFSLYFSRSIFRICGHDNLSTPNSLDNTNTETISAFRSRLYWLFSCLCFTRRRSLCDFPPKQPRVTFGLPYRWNELFYFGMPVVRTDGRSGGRSVYGHVFTKFFRTGMREHRGFLLEVQSHAETFSSRVANPT